MRNASNQTWLNTVGSVVGGIALLGVVGCQAEMDAGALETVESQKSALNGDSNRVILDWNKIIIETWTVHNGYFDPQQTARTQAMVHIAMHDAVASINERYETYSDGIPTDDDADPVAAAAAAAHKVLVTQFPDQAATLDAHLATSLNNNYGGYDEDEIADGIAIGEAAADAILAARENDGSDNFGEYTPGDQPGDYQLHAPYFFAFRPAWGQVQPFGLTSPDQFRSAPPPALDSQQYADEYNEARADGRIDSTTRTADETAYAAFWYEPSEMGWNHVARIVVENDGCLSLSRTARLFALLNIAMADSYIAAFDGKYHYAFWRPITAIPAADTDGNPATESEEGWVPLMDTPPMPDHPSSHATLGNAGAAVLAATFGDFEPFYMYSTTSFDPEEGRFFWTFSQAADENADSRVKAGIHYRSAVNEGQLLGDRIASHVLQNYLPRKY